RIDRLRGDRVAELGPHRQRGLDPFRTAPRLDLADTAGKAGDLIEPQIGQADRFSDLVSVRVQHAWVAFGGHGLTRYVLGELPVHRPALPGHQVSELAQCFRELLRVPERAERPALGWRAAGRARTTRPAAAPALAGEAEAEGRISHLSGLSGRMERSCNPRYPGSSTREHRTSPGSPWAHRHEPAV